MPHNPDFADVVREVVGDTAVRLVAEETGVHRATIYEMLKGWVPRPPVLAQIAERRRLRPSLRQRLFEAAGYEDPFEQTWVPRQAYREGMQRLGERYLVEGKEFDWNSLYARDPEDLDTLSPEQVDDALDSLEAWLKGLPKRGLAYHSHVSPPRGDIAPGSEGAADLAEQVAAKTASVVSGAARLIEGLYELQQRFPGKTIPVPRFSGGAASMTVEGADEILCELERWLEGGAVLTEAKSGRR